MNVSANITDFSEQNFAQFLNEHYGKCHGYISLLFCTFGILNNILNIIILTRRKMVSPTNALLTAIAVADMATMAAYIPFISRFYIVSRMKPTPDHGWGWITYMIFQGGFTVTVHSISAWLTVALTAFRHVIILQSTKAGYKIGTMVNAARAIVVVVVLTVVANVPNYLAFYPQFYANDSNEEVENISQNNESSISLSAISGYWWVAQSDVFPQSVYFWIQAVLFKILPCILSVSLSALLLHQMHKVHQRHLRLRGGVSSGSGGSSEGHNRTTTMLVTIAVLFVSCELPSGVMLTWCAWDNSIFPKYYIHLGDILDILVLINSSINFVMYCTMSQAYRNTFRQLFCPWRHRGRPPGANATRRPRHDKSRGVVELKPMSALRSGVDAGNASVGVGVVDNDTMT